MQSFISLFSITSSSIHKNNVKMLWINLLIISFKNLLFRLIKTSVENIQCFQQKYWKNNINVIYKGIHDIYKDVIFF